MAAPLRGRLVRPILLLREIFPGRSHASVGITRGAARKNPPRAANGGRAPGQIERARAPRREDRSRTRPIDGAARLAGYRGRRGVIGGGAALSGSGGRLRGRAAEAAGKFWRAEIGSSALGT